MLIPIKYGAAIDVYAILITTGSEDAQSNPTLSAGDVKISKDGGAFTNLTTLPTVTPAASVSVKTSLSIAEVTCKVSMVRFKDQTSPAEWKEQTLLFSTYGHPSAFDTSKIDSIRSANAQAGAASSITLDLQASSADRIYNGLQIQIISGTGVGQVRRIVHYVGSSKIAYVNLPWVTNPNSTSGFSLIPFSQIISSIGSGLAQSATSITIALGSHESSINDTYRGGIIKICGGTGIGQIRSIMTYNGTSKSASVDRLWVTNPDSTSLYELVAFDTIGAMGVMAVGNAQAGTTSTMTLATNASSATNYYDGSILQIISGTGSGQSQIITSYNGATRVASITESWAVAPDSTSVYIIRALGDVEVGAVLDKSGYGLSASAISSTTFASGAITSTVIATDAITSAGIAANAIGASQFTQGAADEVWTSATRTLTSVAGLTMSADIIKISGNSSAADNLKSQFDGTTGLTGNNYPARQDQLSSLVAVGAAVNKVMASWTNLSTPVATTETGGVANTQSRDATYDVLTNASQAQDSYYECNIGSTGVPVSVSIYVAVQNATKSVTYYGYDWSSSSYKAIGTQIGTNGLTFVQNSFALTDTMVGTGVNLGKIRIRILSASSNTTVTIDQMYVSYSIINQSIGYVDGAVWIDTINGSSGTTLYVNGVADKPVNSYADAITIANALGVKRFHLSPDSTITLTQNHDYWAFTGRGVINLNNQSINDAVFRESELIYGVSSGQDAWFDKCIIGSTTIDQSTYTECIFLGTFTSVASANYEIDSCIDGIPGSSNPTLVCKANATYGIRGWYGGINVDGLASTNNLYIDGNGRVAFNSNITGGSITLRGFFDITDNVVGGIRSVATMTDTARFNTSQGMASVALIGPDGINSLSLSAGAITSAGIASNAIGASQFTQGAADKSWQTATRILTSFGSLSADVADAVASQILITPSNKLATDISGTVNGNVVSINGSADAADYLAKSAMTMIPGTVDNTAFTATTTELESSDVNDAETNLYKDRWIIFITGNIKREAKPITAYSKISGRGHFTYQTLSSAPSNNDTFIIV